MGTANLLGGIVTVFIYSLIILVFLARLAAYETSEHVLGLVLIALVVPLLYLALTARDASRPALYFIQLGLMIAYLIVELLVDYIFKLDFRSVRWMTITYVTLFFAATGGMLGVASHAGKGWSYASIALFLVMAALAFVQRAVTGM